MIEPQNVESIEKATGKSWGEWEEFFARHGAKELEHAAIADIVHTELEGKIESAGWWSQGVTVAYEQSIGRRAPGQRSDGTYEFAVTKTVDGSREEVYANYLDKLSGIKEFNGHATSKERTSVTPVRSYWKCDLDDGGKITWAFEQKGDGKVTVSVTHANLRSSELADSWRKYWKEYLA